MAASGRFHLPFCIGHDMFDDCKAYLRRPSRGAQEKQKSQRFAPFLRLKGWLAVGFAYVRGRWFADGGRMNFVRFSGELVIYYVLIALGGGVLTSFTFMMFRAIG
jgi:hypothetical protein